MSDRARALQIMRQYGINYANAETVQLAQEARAELTLADEAEVRELVEEQGLRVRGCIGVLIEATKRGVISRDEAKEAIARLVESGYRVSEKVLRLAHKLIGD